MVVECHVINVEPTTDLGNGSSNDKLIREGSSTRRPDGQQGRRFEGTALKHTFNVLSTKYIIKLMKDLRLGRAKRVRAQQ